MLARNGIASRWCLLVFAHRIVEAAQRGVQVGARLLKRFVPRKYETAERRLDVIEFLRVARVLRVDPIALIQKLL